MFIPLKVPLNILWPNYHCYYLTHITNKILFKVCFLVLTGGGVSACE